MTEQSTYVRMDEPRWIGAVVMTDEGRAVYVDLHRWEINWIVVFKVEDDESMYEDFKWARWDELKNPRPTTRKERRWLGVPELASLLDRSGGREAQGRA